MQLRQFKGMLKSGSPPGSVILRKPSIAVVEAMENRQVRFTISTGAIDREKDTVSVAGWDIEAYVRNPVVLWGHKAGELPIGRCIDIGNDGTALRALVDFVPADMPEVGERAEAVLRMCRTGFLSATSVGFRPLEYKIAEDRDDGESWWPPVDFLRHELLEFSVVSVPANPEALIDENERTFVSMLGTAPTAAEIEAGVRAAADEAIAEEQAAAAAETQRIAEVTAARKRRQLESRLVDIGV